MIRLVIPGKEPIHQLAREIEHGNRIVVIFRQLRDNLQGMSPSPTV